MPGTPSRVHVAVGVERQLFHVVDDRTVDHGAVFERPAHQSGALHGRSVVAEGHGAAVGQVAQFGNLFPRTFLRHAGDGMHVHRRGRAALQDELDDVAGVNRRVRVGHAGDGRKSAGRGGLGPGCDRLLVLKPGLPKVNVHVHPARRDHLPRCVVARRIGLRGGEVRADGCDHSVANEHVGCAGRAGDGVQERTAVKEQVGRHAKEGLVKGARRRKAARLIRRLRLRSK